MFSREPGVGGLRVHSHAADECPHLDELQHVVVVVEQAGHAEREVQGHPGALWGAPVQDGQEGEVGEVLAVLRHQPDVPGKSFAPPTLKGDILYRQV